VLCGQQKGSLQPFPRPEPLLFLPSSSCVDPIPDPLLLRKSGSAENRTPTSGSVARSSGRKESISGFKAYSNKKVIVLTYYRYPKDVGE
jgi:hypothetical protein